MTSLGRLVFKGATVSRIFRQIESKQEVNSSVFTFIGLAEFTGPAVALEYAEAKRIAVEGLSIRHLRAGARCLST